MTDLEKELADLRRKHADLERAAEQLRREAAETARELLDVIDRQREALEDAAGAAATVAAIRASNTGRLLGATERWRDRIRRARFALSTTRARGRTRQRRAVPASVAHSPIGVNVSGYLNAESGMGEAARCSIRALRSADVPLALNNIRGPQRMLDATFTDFDESAPHPFNLVHLNADNMQRFALDRGRKYFRNRYTIGYWFWELEQFRPDWLGAFDYVDEVWVASEHTQRSIGKDAPVPVLHMPLGLPELPASAIGRAHFGIPENAFTFLYTFDVSSQMERKNPLGAVRAFKLAGIEYQRAILVLKFTNGHTNRAAVR